MNRVFVCRSLPGSGKSFLVDNMTKNMAPNEFVVCCADDYLTINGQYVWSPERAGAAHIKCYRKFLESLIQKIPNVFLANTNLVWSQFKDYVKYANLAGYEVHLIRPKTWWRNCVEVCYIMNSHGLTYEKLEMMKSRMQTDEEIARFARENLDIEIYYQGKVTS